MNLFFIAWQIQIFGQCKRVHEVVKVWDCVCPKDRESQDCDPCDHGLTTGHPFLDSLLWPLPDAAYPLADGCITGQ